MKSAQKGTKLTRERDELSSFQKGFPREQTRVP